MLEGTFLAALETASNAAPRPAEAHASLRGLIMSGAIPPGERINIEDAARRLSVSPTPVREALASLESEGLVVKIPLRGYRTTELLTRTELVELYELRRLLEPHAAAAAARERSPGIVVALRSEISTIDSTPAPLPAVDLAAHDERLHAIVFDGAGNSLISHAYARTHCHLHIFRLSYAGTYGTHTVEEHSAIVAAIAAGDAAAAETSMREHLDRSLERVLAIFP